MQLPPNLVGAVDLQVRLPDSFDLDAQHIVATCITLQIGSTP
jgi:hypothetical protein